MMATAVSTNNKHVPIASHHTEYVPSHRTNTHLTHRGINTHHKQRHFFHMLTINPCTAHFQARFRDAAATGKRRVWAQRAGKRLQHAPHSKQDTAPASILLGHDAHPANLPEKRRDTVAQKKRWLRPPFVGMVPKGVQVAPIMPHQPQQRIDALTSSFSAGMQPRVWHTKKRRARIEAAHGIVWPAPNAHSSRAMMLRPHGPS